METFDAEARAEGAKYSIFLTEDKVIKRRRDLQEIVKRLSYKRPHWGTRRTVRYARKMIEDREAALRHIEDSSANSDTFCNLETRHRVDVNYRGTKRKLKDVIIQDRVTPFHTYLKRHVRDSPAKLEDRLSEFINANRELWMHGLFEPTFNILHNYGVDSGEQLRLIDPGHVHTDIQEAEDKLSSRFFLENRTSQYMKLFPVYRQLRGPYIEACLSEFTTDAFHDLWPGAE